MTAERNFMTMDFAFLANDDTDFAHLRLDWSTHDCHGAQLRVGERQRKRSGKDAADNLQRRLDWQLLPLTRSLRDGH